MYLARTPMRNKLDYTRRPMHAQCVGDGGCYSPGSNHERTSKVWENCTATA
jgi:hypothetical protein